MSFFRKFIKFGFLIRIKKNKYETKPTGFQLQINENIFAPLPADAFCIARESNQLLKRLNYTLDLKFTLHLTFSEKHYIDSSFTIRFETAKAVNNYRLHSPK